MESWFSQEHLLMLSPNISAFLNNDQPDSTGITETRRFMIGSVAHDLHQTSKSLGVFFKKINTSALRTASCPPFQLV